MFRGFIASVLAGKIKGRFRGRLRSKKSICPRIYTISLSAYQLCFIFGSNMAFVMLGALRDLERYIEKCYNSLIQRIFLGALNTVFFVVLMINGAIGVISEILGAGTTERLLQRITASWTYNDLWKTGLIIFLVCIAGVIIIVLILNKLFD